MRYIQDRLFSLSAQFCTWLMRKQGATYVCISNIEKEDVGI